MSLEKPKGVEDQLKDQFRQAASKYIVKAADVVGYENTKEIVAALTQTQMAMSMKNNEEFENAWRKFKGLNNEVMARGDMFANELANTLLALGNSWSELIIGKE